MQHMNTCPSCGRIAHAGGCDIADFYAWQRFGRHPSPPHAPQVSEEGGGMNEPPPLSLQSPVLNTVAQSSDSDRLHIPKKRKSSKPQGTIKVVSSKVKGVDSPEIIARRIAIREQRVKAMAWARVCRKKKS